MGSVIFNWHTAQSRLLLFLLRGKKIWEMWSSISSVVGRVKRESTFFSVCRRRQLWYCYYQRPEYFSWNGSYWSVYTWVSGNGAFSAKKRSKWRWDEVNRHHAILHLPKTRQVANKDFCLIDKKWWHLWQWLGGWNALAHLWLFQKLIHELVGLYMVNTPKATSSGKIEYSFFAKD